MKLGGRAAGLQLEALDAPAHLRAVGVDAPGGLRERGGGVAHDQVERVVDAVAPARVHVQLEVREREEGLARAIGHYELHGGSPSSLKVVSVNPKLPSHDTVEVPGRSCSKQYEPEPAPSPRTPSAKRSSTSP